MKDKIFISYRRADSAAHAGRLYDSLSNYFGPDRLFMDIDRIEGGDNFVKAIERAVDLTGAMLVVIGKDWLTVNDEKGRKRLDDPKDFVRLEIVTGLSNKLLLIPVLVQGARMPAEEALPSDLRELVYMNAVQASDERWGSDTRRLAKILELDVHGSITERRFERLKRLILVLLFTSVAISTLVGQAIARGVDVTIDFSLWQMLRVSNFILIIAVSILLPMVAGLAEDSSKKFMWFSLACSGLSVFTLARNNFHLSIVANTAILVLLNVSTFRPR